MDDTLLSAGRDQIPTNRGEQGKKESYFGHFWRPFYGTGGKKGTTTQLALLLKKRKPNHEKRDVPYGIWSTGMNQSLDTHSAGTAAKVKNKNQQELHEESLSAATNCH